MDNGNEGGGSQPASLAPESSSPQAYGSPPGPFQGPQARGDGPPARSPPAAPFFPLDDEIGAENDNIGAAISAEQRRLARDSMGTRDDVFRGGGFTQGYLDDVRFFTKQLAEHGSVRNSLIATLSGDVLGLRLGGSGPKPVRSVSDVLVMTAAYTNVFGNLHDGWGRIRGPAGRSDAPWSAVDINQLFAAITFGDLGFKESRDETVFDFIRKTEGLRGISTDELRSLEDIAENAIALCSANRGTSPSTNASTRAPAAAAASIAAVRFDKDLLRARAAVTDLLGLPIKYVAATISRPDQLHWLTESIAATDKYRLDIQGAKFERVVALQHIAAEVDAAAIQQQSAWSALGDLVHDAGLLMADDGTVEIPPGTDPPVELAETRADLVNAITVTAAAVARQQRAVQQSDARDSLEEPQFREIVETLSQLWELYHRGSDLDKAEAELIRRRSDFGSTRRRQPGTPEGMARALELLQRAGPKMIPRPNELVVFEALEATAVFWTTADARRYFANLFTFAMPHGVDVVTGLRQEASRLHNLILAAKEFVSVSDFYSALALLASFDPDGREMYELSTYRAVVGAGSSNPDGGLTFLKEVLAANGCVWEPTISSMIDAARKLARSLDVLEDEKKAAAGLRAQLGGLRQQDQSREGIKPPIKPLGAGGSPAITGAEQGGRTSGKSKWKPPARFPPETTRAAFTRAVKQGKLDELAAGGGPVKSDKSASSVKAVAVKTALKSDGKSTRSSADNRRCIFCKGLLRECLNKCSEKAKFAPEAQATMIRDHVNSKRAAHAAAAPAAVRQAADSAPLADTEREELLRLRELHTLTMEHEAIVRAVADHAAGAHAPSDLFLQSEGEQQAAHARIAATTASGLVVTGYHRQKDEPAPTGSLSLQECWEQQQGEEPGDAAARRLLQERAGRRSVHFSKPPAPTMHVRLAHKVSAANESADDESDMGVLDGVADDVLQEDVAAVVEGSMTPDEQAIMTDLDVTTAVSVLVAAADMASVVEDARRPSIDEVASDRQESQLALADMDVDSGVTNNRPRSRSRSPARAVATAAAKGKQSANQRRPSPPAPAAGSDRRPAHSPPRRTGGGASAAAGAARRGNHAAEHEAREDSRERELAATLSALAARVLNGHRGLQSRNETIRRSLESNNARYHEHNAKYEPQSADSAASEDWRIRDVAIRNERQLARDAAAENVGIDEAAAQAIDSIIAEARNINAHPAQHGRWPSRQLVETAEVMRQALVRFRNAGGREVDEYGATIRGALSPLRRRSLAECDANVDGDVADRPSQVEYDLAKFAEDDKRIRDDHDHARKFSRSRSPPRRETSRHSHPSSRSSRSEHHHQPAQKQRAARKSPPPRRDVPEQRLSLTSSLSPPPAQQLRKRAEPEDGEDSPSSTGRAASSLAAISQQCRPPQTGGAPPAALGAGAASRQPPAPREVAAAATAPGSPQLQEDWTWTGWADMVNAAIITPAGGIKKPKTAAPAKISAAHVVIVIEIGTLPFGGILESRNNWTAAAISPPCVTIALSNPTLNDRTSPADSRSALVSLRTRMQRFWKFAAAQTIHISNVVIVLVGHGSETKGNIGHFSSWPDMSVSAVLRAICGATDPGGKGVDDGRIAAIVLAQCWGAGRVLLQEAPPTNAPILGFSFNCDYVLAAILEKTLCAIMLSNSFAVGPSRGRACYEIASRAMQQVNATGHMLGGHMGLAAEAMADKLRFIPRSAGALAQQALASGLFTTDGTNGIKRLLIWEDKEKIAKQGHREERLRLQIELLDEQAIDEDQLARTSQEQPRPLIAGSSVLAIRVGAAAAVPAASGYERRAAEQDAKGKALFNATISRVRNAASDPWAAADGFLEHDFGPDGTQLPTSLFYELFAWLGNRNRGQAAGLQLAVDTGSDSVSLITAQQAVGFVESGTAELVRLDVPRVAIGFNGDQVPIRYKMRLDISLRRADNEDRLDHSMAIAQHEFFVLPEGKHGDPMQHIAILGAPAIQGSSILSHLSPSERKAFTPATIRRLSWVAAEDVAKELAFEASVRGCRNTVAFMTMGDVNRLYAHELATEERRETRQAVDLAATAMADHEVAAAVRFTSDAQVFDVDAGSVGDGACRIVSANSPPPPLLDNGSSDDAWDDEGARPGQPTGILIGCAEPPWWATEEEAVEQLGAWSRAGLPGVDP